MKFPKPPTSTEPTPIGVLLINVGTPEAPTPSAVRPFLRQFLSDRRVIDYPRWWWLPLLYGVILNVRPRRSARLYQNIWTEDGSPLLVIFRRQVQALQKRLEKNLAGPVKVVMGFRYGNPSIADALQALDDAGVNKLLVLPMYPQNSSTTTATSLDGVFEALRNRLWIPDLRVVTAFHDAPLYIEAAANSIKAFWEQHGLPDKLLFSFHGIPKRYFENGDRYPEACEQTAELVAAKVGLEPDQWGMSYQSRFGPEEWLQPYTDEQLKAWGSAGVEHVQVIAPGFSADCLETIDELGREGRESFLGAGGKIFHYIPALNDRPDHIAALASIVVENIQGWISP